MLLSKDSKLLLALMFYAFLPTLYTTFRIHLLGSYAQSELYIASQIQWLNIIYEVLQEAFIAPLFFFINGIKRNNFSFQERIRAVFYSIILIYFSVFCLVYCYAYEIALFLKQDEALLLQTSRYISLESFAFIFAIIIQFFIVIFVIKMAYKSILGLSFLKLLLIFGCDIYLLHINNIGGGVNGIAYSNIISGVVLTAFGYYKLRELELSLFVNKGFSSLKTLLCYLKDMSKISFIAGLESLLRNAIFTYMILRIVNIINEQALFWLGINFLWSWLLFPIIQLGEIVKKEVSKDSTNLINKFKLYVKRTSFFVLLWLLAIPFYKPFFELVFNTQEYDKVFHIVSVSLPFYILFSYGNIITNIFYALGTVYYIFISSFIVNIFYYGSFFILYYYGFYKPNLDNIVLMFACSMALGAMINFVIFYYLKSKAVLR